MTENIRDDAARTAAGQAGYLIRLAARAPSLHNTQPWRFKVSQDALELYADPKRQLRVDPDGREMLISCGAALYGLRSRSARSAVCRRSSSFLIRPRPPGGGRLLRYGWARPRP